MISAPELVETTEQPAAVIRFTIPRAQIGAVMRAGVGELLAIVTAQRIGPIGPVFSLHRDVAPDIFDFELGVPVSGPVRPEGRVHASRLPAIRVARTIHHGPYEGLAAAWDELDAWITANGHTPAPGIWERYLVGPATESDPANWQTELDHPIR
jgi:effector-binding domain-containing protein